MKDSTVEGRPRCHIINDEHNLCSFVIPLLILELALCMTNSKR